MRDGIFSFYIRCDETATRGIALVENDAVRGFSRSHVYSVERLKTGAVEQLRKDRNTHWRVKAMEHTHADGVRSVWGAFLAGTTSWSRPWSLYVLNEWCRRNL